MSERADILEMLSALQLAGMRAAYDEIVAVGIKRQHGIERIIAALLKAEIAAKQARGAVEDAQSALATTRWRWPSCRWSRSWRT